MKYLLNTTLLLLALFMPTVANAHDFEVDGIYYNINGNEATVTYKGTYSSQYSNEYSGSVIIPETVSYNGVAYSVTSIGKDAFNNCTELTSIDIPNSVTSIGDLAFWFCTGLTSLYIPNSVTVIDQSAFWGCTGLTNIVVASSNPFYDSRDNCNAIIETASNTLIAGCQSTIIPNTVTSIGNCAFARCSGLSSIEIPNSVTFIGFSAFDGCSNLASIEIPDSIPFVGGRAFAGTPWYDNQPNGLVYIGLVAYCYKGDMPSSTNIVIKEGTLEIADGAFYEQGQLTSIVIPNSVTYIGDIAFFGCGLTSIVIPNSVTYIGEMAFEECRLITDIVIPNSISHIGSCAFWACSGCFNVYCYSSNPPLCEDRPFSKYSCTLHVPATSLASYFTAPDWCNFENIVGDAVAPTGISISRDSVETNLCEPFELIATVTPENASNKNITWYSTDTTVATVEDGIVTAVGFGECDIYAYCFGMPAICHVSVTQRISLDQQEASVLPNHILTLTPSALPTLPDLIVTSSDPTVAAARVMNGKVQVVGVAEGKTTITIGSANGLAVPATCLVTVYTEKGDVNMDGFVNISDVTRTISYVLSGNDSGFKFANADLNGDGRVNVSDVTALISRVLTTTE